MKNFAQDSDLIIDLGMNNGDDTDYYLKTGARVVAVDANAALCAAAATRFASHVAKGTLVIRNVAIDADEARKTFFINLDNDHWSSLDQGWATREDSRVRAVEVACMSLARLFDEFGVPKYLKVDVEGADEMVLDQLAEVDTLPFYLSVEDCRFGYRYMSKMATLGYDGFKLLDQSGVAHITDAATSHAFRQGSSGPFGEDVPGQWLSLSAMEDHYAEIVRDRDGNRRAPRTHWWDIHARGAVATN